MGTVRLCFYVVDSAEYSRYEGYAVYLVGAGRCYLFWSVKTEMVLNAIDAFEPSPARKTAPIRPEARKVIPQHDNVRPHVAKPIKTYLETLEWEVLPHPPYSIDIAPSYHYLFLLMTHGLADQQFRSYEDIEKWLDSWIASKDEYFYRNCIWALPERWAKVVANDGQYFAWFICN